MSRPFEILSLSLWLVINACVEASHLVSVVQLVATREHCVVLSGQDVATLIKFLTVLDLSVSRFNSKTENDKLSWQP